MTASIVGSRAWDASATRQTNQQFRVAADNLADALHSTLQRYGDLVQGSTALFEQQLVTRDQYDDYLDSVGFYQNRFPGILGLGYIQRVSQAGLSAFVASARADGLPSYTVAPTGARPTYCLGSYVATVGLIASVPILGYDLCTVKVLASAFDRALNTGQQVVIPGSELSTAYANDFVLIEPVYANGDPGYAAGRQADLNGWSLAIVISSQVRVGVLGSATSRIHFSLTAGATPTMSQAVMSDLSPRGQAATHWVLTQHFAAYNTWTLQMAPQRDAFVPSLLGPDLLRDVGVLAAALLATLIWLLAFSRKRALALVQRRTDQLHHLALHDALTDLPNRALIMDRAAQMLIRAERQQLSVGALFLDLDNFKDVNDSLGHQAGDQLLQAVGARLVSTVRGADTVGRLGGDEFVVLVEDETLVAGPELVAERILAVLAEPFHLAGIESTQIEVRVSIGVAAGPRSNAEELIRDADLALYKAKGLGKNCYVVFHSEMQDAAHERLALGADLRQAMERAQLFLMYQPTFDLESMALTGVEALLRWQHPDRGLVPPDTFIPIAEESGLILEIGRFVLEQACSQGAIWHEAGFPISIAVNVSGRQLDSAHFVDEVRAALATSGLDPGFLTLEVTESVLMRDIAVVRDRLCALKEIGVRIAIDDFGTGYSSLAYLRQFPVDALKIDRSFITHLAESEESGALIHTLVQLGKALHLETLAEGIEKSDQLARLRSEECDSGQGFLFSRPLDAQAVVDFFLDRTMKHAVGVAHEPLTVAGKE
jgi:diguanylate cyclase (GGDEF)-like protein